MGSEGEGFRFLNMEDKVTKLNSLLDKLEQSFASKASFNEDELVSENKNLKIEIINLTEKYNLLKKTSQDVIEELNKSVQVIDEYMNRQKNANNKNSQ